MTKVELENLFKQLKAHYSFFTTEDYVYNEWFRFLKDYDYEDVVQKLDEHLKGEYSKDIPKVTFLIKYLKTTEEKKRLAEQGVEYTVQCNLCHRWMTLTEYNEHYGKCLDIRFLSKNGGVLTEGLTIDELETVPSYEISSLVSKVIKGD